MSARELQRRGREAREWLLDACFPLWSERGTFGCGFLEALDLQHRPIEVGAARVRVQARQTYVFAVAQGLGWSSRHGGGLVQLGLEAMEKNCRREDGLFGRQLDLTTGNLTDETADLYDTAFGLYALSNVHLLALENGQEALAGRAQALIEETVTALDAQLTDATGGYAESLPKPDYRKQNPHMHLFEASLHLAASTGIAHHRQRADELHDLCVKHFIDPDTGTLGEFFVPGSWQIPDGEAGAVVEPGHQFEWVWLFSEHARLAGTKPRPEAQGLYSFACRTLDEEGRVFQSCKRDGTPVDASRRTWQQTEALKAHIAMWRAGDGAAGARAVASFDVLMDEYLTPEGGWIDHYEADGLVRADKMPASTGYHVVLALLDLITNVQT